LGSSATSGTVRASANPRRESSTGQHGSQKTHKYYNLLCVLGDLIHSWMFQIKEWLMDPYYDIYKTLADNWVV
jgi:hypothetical protein